MARVGPARSRRGARLRGASIAALAAAASTWGALAPGRASAQVVNPNPGIVDDGFRMRLDDRGANQSVRERPRPEFDPAGVRIGAFVLRPALDVEAFAASNLLRADGDETSGAGVVIRPRFRLASTWSNHALEVSGGAARSEVPDAPSENATEWELAASGRLDVRRGASLSAAARVFEGVEDRGTIGGFEGAAEPVAFTQTWTSASGVLELVRVRLSGRVDLTTLSYENAVLADGSIVDQSFRDRDQLDVVARVDVARSPAIALFVQTAWNRRDFEENVVGHASRDSQGMNLLVGANFDIGDLMRGEVGAGWIAQTYDEAGFSDVEGFGYRVAVEWFPTRLTTVAVAASSSVEDSAVLGAGGALNRGLGLQVDHELRRNVIVTGRALANRFAFDGFDRTDERTSLSLAATWLANRRVAITGTLAHDLLRSSGSRAGPDFDDTRFTLRLTLRR